MGTPFEIDINEEAKIPNIFKEYANLIYKAKNEAVKENIKANTVLINDKLAKSIGLNICFDDREYRMLPPMIFGMEIRSDNGELLPDGYAFALVEAIKTEREKLIKQTKLETEKKMLNEFKDVLTEMYNDHILKNIYEEKSEIFRSINKRIQILEANNE